MGYVGHLRPHGGLSRPMGVSLVPGGSPWPQDHVRCVEEDPRVRPSVGEGRVVSSSWCPGKECDGILTLSHYLSLAILSPAWPTHLPAWPTHLPARPTHLPAWSTQLATRPGHNGQGGQGLPVLLILPVCRISQASPAFLPFLTHPHTSSTTTQTSPSHHHPQQPPLPPLQPPSSLPSDTCPQPPPWDYTSLFGRHILDPPAVLAFPPPHTTTAW